MESIKAIGFDLFDTLITVRNLDFHEAFGRLMRNLRQQGFAIEDETFVPIYRNSVAHFRKAALKDGRETHNRYWICDALRCLGMRVEPDDARITAAVDGYFSAFLDHATLLPETRQTLVTLKNRYRLGLLSNFTHAPAVKAILDRLDLTPLLDVVLISGELGYRKPHARAFDELKRQFGVSGKQIAFVGDDLDADVQGAQQAGFQAIWSTYAHRDNSDSAARTTPHAPPDVPIIASWDDLLTLLNSQ